MSEPAPREEVSAVRRAVSVGEEEDLRTWAEGVGHQELQFTVRRLSPKYYKGILTEGTLATYDEPVYEDTIREQHGGGNFQVIVKKKNLKGGWQYFTTRTIKIPGNPKIDSLLTTEEAAEKIATPLEGGGPMGGLASQAMSSMQRQLEREQERADRARQSEGGAFNPQMLASLQAPLLAQIEGIQRQMAAKDAQILQLLTAKPDAPPPGGTFQDKILGNMLENESVRLESMRSRHESEVRQLKEGFRQDLDRVHETAKEELRIRERQHERELDMLKETSKNTADTQKTSMDMRIDSLKSEIARLTGELAAAKLEVAELRAKKDKSLPEQADEIMRVQEAFKSLGVGGAKDEDDDSDKPWYERMAGRVLENPEAIGQMLGGVRGAIAPAAQQQQQPQLPPVGQPFQTPDGQVYVSRPDGKVQRLNPAKRAKAAAAAAAVVAAKTGPRPPDATELALAIQFMESAAANGTPPEAFAASARSAIPGEIFAYLEKVGVDELLNNANLDPGSVLRTQSGRNWSRAVVRILLTGE